MSRLFECHAQAALMFSACPRLAAGFDFTAIRDVAFQETAGILVIDLAYMIVAKLAYFAARSALASPALASLATWGTFSSSLHRLFSCLFVYFNPRPTRS
jgi:hypothetical protein